MIRKVVIITWTIIMTGKNIYKADIGRREWVPNVSIVKIAARNPMLRLIGCMVEKLGQASK